MNPTMDRADFTPALPQQGVGLKLYRFRTPDRIGNLSRYAATRPLSWIARAAGCRSAAYFLHLAIEPNISSPTIHLDVKRVTRR